MKIAVFCFDQKSFRILVMRRESWRLSISNLSFWGKASFDRWALCFLKIVRKNRIFRKYSRFISNFLETPGL